MMRAVELPQFSAPAPGMRSLLRIEGKTIAVFNVGGTLYAIDDSCPHAGGSLVVGKLDGRFVACPSHGLKFDLASGCVRSGGSLGVKTYALCEAGGKFTIALPDDRAEEACK